MLLVVCPQCKNKMKYLPRGQAKSKRCVYCGRNFKISPERIAAR